jgi:Transcriptional regulator LmrA/YxaF-like, C-terminal domain
LGAAANCFFVQWGDMLRDLFEEAKESGSLPQDTDSDSLSYLVMSSIEGALILFKASKDSESFIRVGKGLKSVIACMRI